MTRYLYALLMCLAMAAGTATAAQAELKYYPDPAYHKLNSDDPHPMDEMIDLAKQGDARAQFILGDMYEKGKGGLEKDMKESRHWFEESAVHGYSHSFIRLAALAKHEDNPVEAWQWYTLAINSFDSGDAQQFVIKARHDLVETAELSRDDIWEARKAVDAWEDSRDKQLRMEKEQQEKDAEAKLAASEHPDKKPAQQEKENEQN